MPNNLRLDRQNEQEQEGLEGRWNFGHPRSERDAATSRNDGDCAFEADYEGSAFGVGAYGVELGVRFFSWANSGGVFGWAKVIDEFGADDKEAEVGLVFVQGVGFGVFVFVIIGYGRVVGLRLDLR